MDIFSFLIVISVIILEGISQYFHRKEREKLLKMKMARNLSELTDNEYTEKLKPQKQTASDLIPLTPDNPMFDSAIQKQVEDGEADHD